MGRIAKSCILIAAISVVITIYIIFISDYQYIDETQDGESSPNSENADKIFHFNITTNKTQSDADVITNRDITPIGDVQIEKDTKLKRNSRSDKAFSNGNYTGEYMFNSSNIPDIKIKRILGSGAFKIGYLGEYKGMQVAVRTSKIPEDRHKCDGETDASKPEFQYNDCYGKRSYMVMQEIYLLDKLRHRNIANLLGFCLACQIYNGTSLLHSGVVVVTEYGQPIKESSSIMISAPWNERLEYLKQMAELMYYLEHSPLGSLINGDFKVRHFVLMNSILKVYDIDKFRPSEHTCDIIAGGCRYNITCDKETKSCIGQNAKYNMFTMYMMFRKTWINPYYYPIQVSPEIIGIRTDLSELKLDGFELKIRIERILDKWKKLISSSAELTTP